MIDVLRTKTGWQREGTNNTAEWMALLSGMGLMIEHWGNNDEDEYIILTDSQLIRGQASGEWKVRNNELKYYYAEFRVRERQAHEINFEIQWIPRIFNRAADAYSKLVNPYFKEKIKNELRPKQSTSEVQDIREFQGTHVRKNQG